MARQALPNLDIEAQRLRQNLNAAALERVRV
jgi:hypothetical protein